MLRNLLACLSVFSFSALGASVGNYPGYHHHKHRHHCEVCFEVIMVAEFQCESIAAWEGDHLYFTPSSVKKEGDIYAVQSGMAIHIIQDMEFDHHGKPYVKVSESALRREAWHLGLITKKEISRSIQFLINLHKQK